MTNAAVTSKLFLKLSDRFTQDVLSALEHRDHRRHDFFLYAAILSLEIQKWNHDLTLLEDQLNSALQSHEQPNICVPRFQPVLFVPSVLFVFFLNLQGSTRAQAPNRVLTPNSPVVSQKPAVK